MHAEIPGHRAIHSVVALIVVIVVRVELLRHPALKKNHAIHAHVERRKNGEHNEGRVVH